MAAPAPFRSTGNGAPVRSRMLGRVLLTVDSIGLLFGAVIADWNETHVYNPRWPPHAKSVPPAAVS